LTLEGEIDTPPILKAAFARQPLAEAGWQAMTPAQRRGHLMGIFYYETAETRGRRAAKAVEEALKVARRRLSAPK
ncbi:MAG: YdeI/OmpD-associated family protein, partial [Terracidiphilus sp.]